MAVRITVTPRTGPDDAAARHLLAKARRLGYTVESAVISSVTVLEGPDPEQAGQAARELLADSVTEEFQIGRPEPQPGWVHCHIFPLPGVTNPVEDTVSKALQDLELPLTARPRVGREIALKGVDAETAQKFARDALYNPVIEICHLDLTDDTPPAPSPESPFQLTTVPIRELDDKQLVELSTTGLLALDLEEMRTIQAHFRDMDRDPTDIELETLAQTWSEHCCHKTLTARVDCGERTVNNILKSTIAASTEKLNKDWCVSVFKDNAGVIAFDDEDGISFKVETHNHPSAIEPYGGAGTGLGGCIRDTLGTGCAARPIANTDVFCFAPVDTPAEDLPPGVLPPRRLLENVVAGVRDYGNRMGIPTVNGAVCFDPDYVGNPLVYCGSLGIIPLEHVDKVVSHGDKIVAIGGHTGRDGIHGATFSSIELDDASQDHSSGAVQIGNPIIEKMTLDVLIQARDRGLIKAVTDCGAGGFSSAVGEMGEHVGATVDLEQAPLKYSGLKYWEIWISEAQERMVLAVDPADLDTFQKLCEDEDVSCTVLGTFGTPDRELVLRWNGTEVGRLSMAFLHDGRPDHVRKAVLPEISRVRGPAPQGDPGAILERILSSPNVASKEWIIRQYDHEVQAGSIVKPLVGICNDGPGDAAVIAPKFNSDRGVVVSNGINPHYGRIDPYAMTWACVDEALRNVIAVGGSLERCALLDNFSWGNTRSEEGLGRILRAAEACHDAALCFETPFVSGKDSLNNEFRTGDKRIVIPDTMLISAFAITNDVTRSLTMDLKAPGNALYMVGLTDWELGGSHFDLVTNRSGDSTVPLVDGPRNRSLYDTLAKASAQRLIRSAHDCSEGGLAVAAAEMAFAGGVGLELALDDMPVSEDLPDLVRLFSESTGRLLLEIESGNRQAFEDLLQGHPCACIGRTTESDRLVVSSGSRQVVDRTLASLKDAWQAPLRFEDDS